MCQKNVQLTILLKLNLFPVIHNKMYRYQSTALILRKI